MSPLLVLLTTKLEPYSVAVWELWIFPLLGAPLLMDRKFLLLTFILVLVVKQVVIKVPALASQV
jgi:hypothetical protein